MAPTCLLCWVCSLLCVWSVVMGHPCSLHRQVGGPWGLRRGQQLGAGRAPLLLLPPQRGRQGLAGSSCSAQLKRRGAMKTHGSQQS